MTRPLNHRGARRAVGLLATPALALATIAALPATPSYAAEADPIPATAGAGWLVAQLEDGLLPSQFGGGTYDHGLSIDAALALDELGLQSAAVTAIRDAVEGDLDLYAGDYTYTSPDPYPEGPEATFAGHSSNAVAKAAVLARATGAAPTSFGGRDLVTELVGMIGTEGLSLGRLSDDPTKNGQPYPAGDYANTIGQSFAVRALDEAGEDVTDETSFLLAQQCDAGFFRLSFAAVDAASQQCTTGTPDTDVTALALLNLAGLADANPEVSAAITDGLDWLEATQHNDGAFGDAGPIAQPNSNTTGLAGWALGEHGRTALAAKAATWVRSVQADDPEPCTTGLTDEVGAIGYDGSGHGLGRSEGITEATGDQWRRSTAQALPVLQWAPATGSGRIATVNDNGFRKAGTSVRVAADGIAPGDTVCVARAGKLEALLTAGDNGQAIGRVALPNGTAKRTYLLSNNESELSMFTFHALGAKKLGLGLSRSRIARGQVERVRVTKLVAGERVKVVFRGKVVRSGKANRSGAFTVSFRVTGRPGFAGVKVIGQFANRANAKTLTVTR